MTFRFKPKQLSNNHNAPYAYVVSNSMIPGLCSINNLDKWKNENISHKDVRTID